MREVALLNQTTELPVAGSGGNERSGMSSGGPNTPCPTRSRLSLH